MDLIMSAIRILTFRRVYGTNNQLQQQSVQNEQSEQETKSPVTSTETAQPCIAAVEKVAAVVPSKRSRKTLAGSLVSASEAGKPEKGNNDTGDDDNDDAANRWRSTVAPLQQQQQVAPVVMTGATATASLEAPPLQILYEKLLSVAQPFRWDSTGCYLTNIRYHQPSSSSSSSSVSLSFQILSSGYLVSVTLRQLEPPLGRLAIACDPAVPELAPLWAQLTRPELATQADRFLVDAVMPAFASAVTA